jgi:hypothetical protein
MSWTRMGLSKVNGGMGFRDLGMFNKALLAKQAWRLWHSPNSFLSKIMEAKYYWGGNFLELKLGVWPSFAWRSIFSSCELLKEGLIWRIGNGDKVCIWQDKWIPRSSTVLMQPQQPYWDPNARVSSLIDHETNWWKSDVLGDLFDE